MRKKIIFILILALAIGLRFWNLAKVPPSPDWDEAAIGWNAYSIWKTGKDEYGVKFPLTFRSFDDYKPPLYFYLTIPSIIVFGVNLFAVRLPSAVFGVIGVIGVYFLIKLLFKKENLALLSMFFMAISPWHLQFSRIAFEANVALAWEILGTILFLKSVKKNKFFLLLSTLSFGLALYTYHSARVFVPFLVLVLIMTYFRQLLKIKKIVLLSGIIALIFIWPLVKIMTSTEGQMRLKGVSAFSDTINLLSKDSKKISQDLEKGIWWGSLVHNRRIRYVLRFLESYTAHFNPNWLFVNGEGDVQRHHVPDVGMLYFWELPFILWGIYSLFFWPDKKPKLIIFSWWLLAPIAASVSADVPHAVRTLCFLPTWHVFTALGVLAFIRWGNSLKNKLITAIIYFVTTGLFLVNFIFYLHQYHIHQPIEYSRYWQYGYKELFKELEKLENKYEKVRISIEAEQPYMFFLFYKKYNPAKYLEQGGTISGGFWEEHKIGKYEFVRFDWEKEDKRDKIWWVVTDKELPGDAKIIKTIYLLNGEPILHIFKI